MRCKLFIIALLLALCGCAHPYIGLPVRTTGPYWCHIHAIPQPCSCIIQTEHLKFVFETSYNDVSGECSIIGHIEPISIKSFSNFQVEKSTFYFVLARNGIIVDVVSFLLSSNNPGNNIPLNLKFKSKPFDAISIDYYFYVTG